MRTRKEKPIFRNLTITVAGSLIDPNGDGSTQWTDINIDRWVTLRDGRFTRAMTDDVTHVVCTAEEFERRGLVVKEALKRPKTCQIVTLDWLEDSMHKRKRLDEEPYSHLRALRRARERERKRLMVVKGLEKAVKQVNPNLYHLYRDHTFFQYEVVITRDDEEAGILGERYILSLFESNNAKPRLYWFLAKYYKKKGDTQAKIHRPSHAPGLFAREFALFESFFRIKTGIPWEQRLLGVKGGEGRERVFRYQPPTGGKPVGWAPAQYIPAEEITDDSVAPLPEGSNNHTDPQDVKMAGTETETAPATAIQLPGLVKTEHDGHDIDESNESNGSNTDVPTTETTITSGISTQEVFPFIAQESTPAQYIPVEETSEITASLLTLGSNNHNDAQDVEMAGTEAETETARAATMELSNLVRTERDGYDANESGAPNTDVPVTEITTTPSISTQEEVSLIAQESTPAPASTMPSTSTLPSTLPPASTSTPSSAPL
ncbi:hypothetical protein B0J18DRAFT_478954 [Chaetomium sp. MPI-SDFR-AT-0129]|nr:hypothetical protein B0J18DRAFT_478954 [Chaetomium sp. MPI-SDFR-AT-0129]